MRYVALLCIISYGKICVNLSISAAQYGFTLRLHLRELKMGNDHDRVNFSNGEKYKPTVNWYLYCGCGVKERCRHGAHPEAEIWTIGLSCYKDEPRNFTLLLKVILGCSTLKRH